MNEATYKSDFVNVNGIALHYLDWGGSGETLLFLTGIGSSAHLFDRLASRFTDQFHVLALTRRGQGVSDHPETGYDLDTLIHDIHDFMDELKINKAILAGNSFAGKELTYFAEKYPEKILQLVYLDAAYDSQGRFELFQLDPRRNMQPPEMKAKFESIEEYVTFIQYYRPDLAAIWNSSFDVSTTYDLEQTPTGIFIPKDTSAIVMQMIEGVNRHVPQAATIQVPVLSFVVISEPTLPAFYTTAQKQLVVKFHHEEWIPFQRREIGNFKHDIPHAKVIEILGGHHYCFIAQEEFVFGEMNEFLQLTANK